MVANEFHTSSEYFRANNAFMINELIISYLFQCDIKIRQDPTPIVNEKRVAKDLEATDIS